MSKLPFLQFYPSDYLVDTRVLSLAARGAWVDMICVLHASSTRGTSTLPARGWARIMGASEEDFQSALAEIEEMKVGDVIRECNGNVSVTCRRMMNESITREQTRLRVQNHRKKHGNKAGNESGNADVTGNKSEVISQKSEAKKDIASVPDASSTGQTDLAGLIPPPPMPPPKPSKTQKPKHERNAIKDALAVCGGGDPAQVVPSAWSGIQKALTDIMAVCPDVTVEEIVRRSLNYRTHMDSVPLTPFALAKNWALCEKPNRFTNSGQKPGGTSTYELEARAHGYTL
jgi:hypothetical protein